MIAEKFDQFSLGCLEATEVREKISLFGALSDAQLHSILPRLKIVDKKAGDIIFQQGQLPCNVYIVLRGEVLMRVTRDDGSIANVEYALGDCFGETAVIGIQSQLGEARALSDTALMVLSRSDLLDIANHDSEIFGILMMNIAREVSRRLHAAITTLPGSERYRTCCN